MMLNTRIFQFILFSWIVFIPFKDSLYQIFTILLVVYFFSFVFYNRDFKSIASIVNKYSDLILCFLFILTTMIVSNLANEVDFESWKLIFYYFLRYGLIVFILIYFYSKSFFTKRLLLIFILFSLFLQSFDGLFQSIYGFDIFKHQPGNIHTGLTGAIYNKNVFGFFMGLGVLITFLFLRDNKKILSSLLILIFFFCVLFAYSRAIWVSLFFSLLVYFILNFKELKQNFLLIGIVIFVISLIFFNIDALQTKLDSLLEGDSSHRKEIWLHGLNLIKEKWLLGYGVDMFDMHPYKGIKSMHNQTLEIIFDLGIIGFIAFFTLLLLILKELKTFNNEKLFIIMIYFLVNGMFGESIISSKTMLSSLSIFIVFIFIDRIKFKKEAS